MNSIACLKHGNKYSAEYVNVLYNMVSRYLTVEHEFVCFTEDSKGINPEIRIEPLPKMPVQGWWYKPMFFNPELGIKGTIVFLDLDIIIFRNIDWLFTYKPTEFCIIRDFNRRNSPNLIKMNSSIFRIETGQHRHVYDNFINDPVRNSRKFHGDQDWIFAQTKNNKYQFWPDSYIQSYKWEMRKGAKVVVTNSRRNFEEIGEPAVLPDTSIAVFHGEPNPHTCADAWCIQHWR
jgi:hypothetical protein